MTKRIKCCGLRLRVRKAEALVGTSSSYAGCWSLDCHLPIDYATPDKTVVRFGAKSEAIERGKIPHRC